VYFDTQERDGKKVQEAVASSLNRVQVTG